jgi:GAF domain-containing protein
MPETHGHVEHAPAAPPAPPQPPTDAEMDVMKADAARVGQARARLMACLRPSAGQVQAQEIHYPSAQEIAAATRAMLDAEAEFNAAAFGAGIEVHVSRLVNEVRNLRARLAAGGR